MHDRDVRIAAVNAWRATLPAIDHAPPKHTQPLVGASLSSTHAREAPEEAVLVARATGNPLAREQALAALQRRHGNHHVAGVLAAARALQDETRARPEPPQCAGTHRDGECECGCREAAELGRARRCELAGDTEEAEEASAVSRAAPPGSASSAALAPGTSVRVTKGGAPAAGNRPHQGAATIVCDGAGGYRADLRGWAGVGCGIEGCVRRHEESHAADWRGRWPNGCRNSDGTPKPDGSSIPLGGPGYNAFLRASECTAYGVEETCVTGLLRGASDACKPQLRSHLADTRAQKRSFC